MKTFLTAFILVSSFSFLYLYNYQTQSFDEINYDNSVLFDGYNSTNFNDFFEELYYIRLDSNPYSPLDAVDKIRFINDTFYVTDVNFRGKVFLYSALGEFINKIGFNPSLNLSGNTFFEKCIDSGHLIIGYPDEQKLLIFSNDGDLVSQDSVGFYFDNFVYNSMLKRYIFHTHMPNPGFYDNLNHQLVLTDSNFTIIRKHFPKQYNITKEFNATYAIQKPIDSGDFVYFADFFNGKIYELDFKGNEKLIFKIEDGIENRQDSLIMMDAEFPSYEVVMHNKKFYPFTEYYINEDFLLLSNYFEQRVRTHVVFSRETLNGYRFANNIPINLESGHQFNFHFETPTSVIGSYFVRFRSPRTWNQIISFLPDSIDISHLPDSIASGPIMKLFKYNRTLIGIDDSADRRLNPDFQNKSQNVKITCYPNPTSGILTVESTPSVSSDHFIVKIFSLDGIKLGVIKGEKTIDFPSLGLNYGTYILQFSTSEDGETIKNLGSELIFYQ
ncbi:MAG: 6-bladed beta-propeller [Saprospirales bacterium]|nr:MAG: 6-bladed beta-propeller [Saprospirales bacterium]